MAGDAWSDAHGARYALIVACTEYQDPGLGGLLAPAADAGALARVLGDPAIGDFEVTTLLNQSAHVVSEAVEEFLADRSRDDLLLLHFSGHGIKDQAGELYFAMANTRLRLLAATAVAANFVNRLMTQSRSHRIVLFLDCCYAGAFERGMTSRAGQVIDFESRFEGRGRAVITASGAVEYAFEAGELTESGDPGPSVFTDAMVRGLSTGEADRDQDGYVDLDELYDYVYGAVRDVTPHQTPGKWTYGVQGDLVIARRDTPVTEPAPLPPELQQSIESPLAGVRAGAADELARLLTGRHQGLALAARLSLEQLADDDSRTVVAAASAALEASPAAEPSTPIGKIPTTATERTAAPEAKVSPPRPRSMRTVALTTRQGSRKWLFGRRGAALAVCSVVLLVAAFVVWRQAAGEEHSTTIPSSFDGVWTGTGSASDGSEADFEARLGEGLTTARLNSGASACYGGQLTVSDATDSTLTTRFVAGADASEKCPNWEVVFTHDSGDLIMHVNPDSTENNQQDFEIRLSPSS